MKYDVVILPSFAQVEAWRKRHALERGGGVFAQAATTFDAWIADLWELHGDGRLIVDSSQRAILMRSVFPPEAPKGLVSVATRCAREALGVEAFEKALERVGAGETMGLSELECSFLAHVSRYRDVLGERGLVEVGQATAWMACRAAQVFPEEVKVLVAGGAPLSWVQEQFLGQGGQLDVTMASPDGGPGIGKVPEGVSVSFACPSGRLAQPGAIADVVEARGADGPIVITGRDPLRLFDCLAERLSEVGRLRVQATKPFPLTDFGKAFLACHHAVHDSPWDPACLADAVGSFFSGISRADAVAVDDRLRRDRIADRDEALAGLRASSELFSQLEELACDPEADVLVGVFEQRVQAASHRSAAWRAEQVSALGKLRSATSAARAAGLGIAECVDVLQDAAVPVAAQVGRESPQGVDVLVTSQGLAASLPASSCATAIIADLTSDDYPVSDRDDALASLYAGLGMQPAETVLERARREFTALLGLACAHVVLVRPLGGDDAAETYPALVLEELVDAYRPDPSATDDIDNAYRLPERMQEGLVVRGEELLYANARSAAPTAVQGMAGTVARPRLQDIGPDQASLVMPRRYDSEGNPLQGACPSPSQIELYLECPYQWFVCRSLGASGLDEGFGPLERGTFAHAALERFYRLFREQGNAKVNGENLPQAREVMRGVLRALVDEQPSREPGSGRLVPSTELERREVAALCEQLVSYLDFEARLLPAFRPAHLEYEIDADHAVGYAGYSLVGKVDRIDVDDAGNAVIIDYKGSVNAEHEIAGKTAEHMGKVQTRVYAQAVERALGLKVVAALYVSYGRNPAVSGAFDPFAIEAAHLPGVKADRCACGTLDELPGASGDESLESLTFHAMLAETERLAGRAIEGMQAGVIAPKPANARACGYCPVLACPERR